MVKVGELYGELRLNKRPFDQGLDQAEHKARGWSSRVGGILSGAAGFLLKWGTIGAAAVATFAWSTANAASDLHETMSKVSVVFGDAASEILAWGQNSAASLGMSKNAALGAAGTYGNLFRSMGITTGKSAEMSTSLVELAADLASFNNMDPTEVLDKLRSGLTGETEPLKTLGVNLNQATIEAKALQLGLWNGKGTIDAAAKAQASYALILEQTSLAQGDFARTSDGMANQQRVLGATVEDSMAAIGAAFMPIIASILPQVSAAFSGLSVWVQENMPTIQSIVGTVVEAVGWYFTEFLVPAIQRSIDTFTFIAENVMPIVAAAFQWISEEILPRLRAVFAAVQEWITANWPTISRIVGHVATAVQGAFNLIATIIRNVWPVIEAVAKVLFPVLGAAATVLLNVMDGVFGAIASIWSGAADVAQTVFDTISSVWNGLGDVMGKVWKGVNDAVKGGINFFISLINGVIGMVNSIQIHIPEVGVGPIHTPAFDWNGLNLPKIPYLASGVRDFRGGWAWVGERGPELVNLPRGANVYSAQESAGMAGEHVIRHRIEDPSGVLARMGTTPAQVAQMLADSLNVDPFVRQLRHDAVRS